jgi:hypothetical protein
MPAFPGPTAFAAFAGVKFGGYTLAGTALRKLQPAITASSVKIAAVRTGLGILLGPPITLAVIVALEHFTHPSPDSSTFTLYPFLFLLRTLIWALVIFIFTKGFILAESKLWAYACAGAFWSCLLDLPGFWLAIISPGQIPIC